jgi:hypothetical protein
MRRLKYIIIAAIIALPLAITPIFAGNAAAISSSQWSAGRIIDDSLFYNGSSMSISQIQSFLNAKVPSCDSQGEKMHSSGQTRAQYAASRGVSTPFKCLKNYSQNLSSPISGDGLCNGLSSGSKSAARIIYEVGKSCGVSQKVLLILLQKEQSLITDDWPWPVQYRIATGYACPDTAPCNSLYYGFINQVYKAAWQYKVYRAYPHNYNHIARTNNNVRFHPNASCGSSTVFIQNQATAGLYNYTPYQPNSAKLNGNPNGCSSHGNYNFWNLHWNWFGSPIGPDNLAVFKGHSGKATLKPGQSVTAYITYENLGRTTWYDDYAINNDLAPSGAKPTRLATASPVNRHSAFSETWMSKGRATGNFHTVYAAGGDAYSTNPHKVSPGESVKFQFTFSVPDDYKPGTYKEYFTPLIEGGGVINSSRVSLDITVLRTYSVAFKGQSAYPTIKPGQTSKAHVIYQNTGNYPWYDNIAYSKGQTPSDVTPTRLGTYNPTNRASDFGTLWGAARNRATGVFAKVYHSDGVTVSGNQRIALPKQIVKFEFDFKVPDGYAPGTYREYFAPLIEGKTYIPTTTFLDVTVPTAATAKPSKNISTTVNPLTSKEITVSFKNSGNTTWSKASTTLRLTNSPTSLQADNWINSQTPARLNEDSVAPGGTGTFTFTVKTPYDAGSHNLKFSPSISGTTIALQDQTTTIKVAEPKYQASFNNQSRYPEMRQTQSREVFFRFKNTGNTPWYGTNAARPSGVPAVVLASTTPINRPSNFGSDFDTPNRPRTNFSAVYASNGTSLTSNQNVVFPGEIGEFRFTLSAKQDQSTGKHREWFQPIVEGGSPWSMDARAFLDVYVLQGKLTAGFVSQSNYPTIAAGNSANVNILFRNTGNVAWYDDTAINSFAPVDSKPTRLATTSPINRSSIFGSGWSISPGRPAGNFNAVFESDGTTLAANQHAVLPGQIARFNFALSVPPSQASGTYREWFQPIVEGGSPWSMDARAFLNILVP